MNLDSTTMLLDDQQRNELTVQARSLLQEGLEIALNDVYWVVFGFAVLSFLFILLLPKKQKADV